MTLNVRSNSCSQMSVIFCSKKKAHSAKTVLLFLIWWLGVCEIDSRHVSTHYMAWNGARRPLCRCLKTPCVPNHQKDEDSDGEIWDDICRIVNAVQIRHAQSNKRCVKTCSNSPWQVLRGIGTHFNWKVPRRTGALTIPRYFHQFIYIDV